MKTRVLQFSTKNGSKEYVVFTEDLKADADTFRRADFERCSDTIIDVEMPGGFPLGYQLDRY